MRKRNRRFSLWLNEKEFNRFTKNAEIAGLKKEPYLRKLIMGYEIRPRPPDEYAQLLRQLSAIGNNINQMAYKANGLGEICVEEVRAMRVAFEKLYKEVKR